jgi:23S rRNA (pseudouridine1915-N3)-methyltransferase
LIRIKVIAIGKSKENWIKEGTLHYKKLLKKYVDLELLEIKEERIIKSKEIQALLDAEAERILKCLEKSGSMKFPNLLIGLDVEGENLSSESLARLLNEKLNKGYNEFTFILGGATGLSRKVLDVCPLKLSLSQMTFTHEMSKLILLEQIYRAFSILKGAKYHK